MATQIPLQLNSDNYEIRVTLEDVEYLFAFKYNGRSGSWFFDVLAADETPLRMGIPIVLSSDLWNGWTEETRPEGYLLALPLGEPTDPPTRDDVRGGLMIFLFVPFDEIEDPGFITVENPGPIFLT